MSSSASFSLKPITEDDIPALTKMESLTFESDRHTLLKAAHPTRPYDHAAGVPDMIKYRLSLPANKVELIKAVDDETGEILGHVCWGLRLSVPQPQPQPPEPSSTEQAEQGKAKNSSKLPARVVPQDYEKTNAPDLDSIAQLEELTSSHFADFMKRVMPDGTRCMYVVGLSVHPAHQLRGVGTALMRRGTDRADAEGVFCWVHSSEAAAGMYRKCGFEVDDTLEIDLDHWAAPLDIKPPAGDEKWGTYTFKYMIRQPRAVKDALSS
ncbi:acyl-CoA N-acyltransferase [Cryphonectria parasitica EP155]|uniref:Acyl-CoA N-acyltransferase n=1 Tax=Cryphonectria parasitica (strain ATCC 38755 / EP155) TaxID=660469 RepID=A0A9P4Y5M7_CRYP1|nr:acyl-CoA N-acyltransferase [Cryphonectria parasitica EP155]KAF3766931.1 acyl-CoA N-acyltransferase [Cryphonectria parasitica EP155]